MQSGHGLALALAVALRGVRGVGEAGLASVARASGGLGGMGEAQYSEAAVFLDVTGWPLASYPAVLPCPAHTHHLP
eukprot:CAMPEP_0179967602 /NCGR_PEP_ID=MMETSP0983-20121128/33303_1 /TAXON_ID=483367 /ORGANISM="non described non described, Strain CCMP 2436" /LENGTH=75 /DNA_ID=CAMNT_0021881113 /DNA_START=41 /DNA_END=264 /DNA_ORIENTATION=+